MAEKQRLWSGGWWHFSRYEIRDGAIRPSENASFEWYDPWEAYLRSKNDKWGAPPYQSLLALLSEVLDLDGPDFTLGPDWAADSLTSSQQSRVLDWCSRFGLLGIMPHMAIGIQLPTKGSRRSQQRFDLTSSSFARIVELGEHVRMNGKWIEGPRGGRVLLDLVKVLEFILQQARAAVPRGLEEAGKLIRRSRPVPRIFFRDPDQRNLKSEPVAKILAAYFPDFKDEGNQFVCPSPLQPEFWKIYSETVHDFLKTALAFRKAVVPISGHHDRESLEWFEWFLEPIGISLSLDSNNQVQEEWICPSLLSSFGRMALQDLSAGMRFLICECCKSPFVTSSYQARYCSQRCGWKHRKCRARAPKAEGYLKAAIGQAKNSPTPDARK